MTVRDALAMAIDFHRNGRIGEAEAVYKKILEVEPNQADTLLFLGILWHQTGHEDALVLIEKSLKLNPKNPDAYSNYGNVLKERSRLDDAEAAFRRAIELQPDHADACNNLGTVLKTSGRYEEAESALRRAISIHPEHADAHHNLGNVLRHLGRNDEATDAFHKSIQLKPNQSSAYQSLAAYLSHTGRIKEAAKALREWLTYQPDNPVALHLLSAVTEGEAPTRASDEYVSANFDEFASTFDRHLQTLKYQAPTRIVELMKGVLPDADENLDLLDAGCGTGLAAPHLRPFADKLVGVDLSSGMVDRARERGGYDGLHVGELTAFLEERDSEFDAVVICDTFCYFGDLEEALRASKKALRDDGHIFFTVEANSDEETEYELHPSGRYSHSRSYIEDVIDAAGLVVVEIQSDMLRMEIGEKVDGYYVAARPARD